MQMADSDESNFGLLFCEHVNIAALIPRDALCVRPTVCLSVRDVDVPWRVCWVNSKTIMLRIFAPKNHNIGNLVQGEHPQNLGGIWVGSLFSAENLQYL